MYKKNLTNALFVLSLHLFSCSDSAKKNEDKATISEENAKENVASKIQLRELSGKTVENVETILGKGKLESKWKDERAGCKECPKYVYKNGSIEVIYIKGVADRITLNGLNEYDYPQGALQALGIESVNADFSNDIVTRWKNIPGFIEISAFNGLNNKIDYVLVKTKAE